MSEPLGSGIRLDKLVGDEAENYELCPICGQAFDRRDLASVLHHAEEGHGREDRREN